jgi:hypothetical protein
MGIDKFTLDFIETEITKFNHIGALNMVELGNQFIKGSALPTGKIAKNYFLSKGFFHVSIDINGKDGALEINLNQEIMNINLLKKFDILTNCGTSEHITNQYICWKNIHNLVRKDGIFIHLVPLVNNWKGHGYYKFTTHFFDNLSIQCHYHIESQFVRESKERDLIYCSMIKLEDNEFISIKDFIPPIKG